MGSWYVIVEYGQYGEREFLPRIAVDGDREAALTAAEEQSRTRHVGIYDREHAGRVVYRESPERWLVEVSHPGEWNKNSESYTVHTYFLRISVAELEHVAELRLPDPPRRGLLRRG
ncbi:hypothetical protein ACIA8O_09080 [Kitasatospora sp. NPDC051853]|uniref:hypothetical protein n=1 Tax=Kitasatospora sp. NPDC051853 TaxID=3364058 RepID=UPI0037B96753